MIGKVLYIAGYGRSGTTILDMALSCHPRIVSGGEIFRAAEIFEDPEALCTCGAPLADCEVWRDVRSAFVAAARARGGLAALQGQFRAIEGRGGSEVDAPTRALWRDLNRQVFDALRAAKPGSDWVVDSSKLARGAARRPLLLDAEPDGDVRLLPVRRRAGAVIASVRKGSNRALEAGQGAGPRLPALRAYAGWIMAEAAIRTASRSLDSLPLVTHESLVEDPEAARGRIISALGLDPDPGWQDRMGQEVRHMIGGNRTRFDTPRIRRAEAPLARSDAITVVGKAIGAALSAGRVL